jgi:hypothetical protein
MELCGFVRLHAREGEESVVEEALRDVTGLLREEAVPLGGGAKLWESRPLLVWWEAGNYTSFRGKLLPPGKGAR